MTAAPPIVGFGGPHVALDAQGRVAESIVCRRCGYDLKGLDPHSRCPECGTAVGRTIYGGDLLRFAPPEWVEKLASGMLWIIVAVLGSIALGLLANFAVPVIGLAGDVSLSVVSLAGYWLVTTPDPSMDLSREGISARVVARWGAVAAIIGGLVVSFLQVQQLQAPSVPLMIVAIALAIVGVAGYFALFVYGRRLALRIPDDGLARQTMIVMWGVVACYGFAIVMIGVGVAATSAASPGAGMGTLVGIACAVGIALLVFGIWSIVLLFRYRAAFKSAAEQARRSWYADIAERSVRFPGA